MVFRHLSHLEKALFSPKAPLYPLTLRLYHSIKKKDMSRYTPYFYQKDQTRAVSLTNKRHGSHATEVPTLSQ